MGIGKDGAALRRLRTLFDVGAIRELSDGQLLERFAAGPSEAAELAFAVLVERHGPMILHVCRSVLADRHDSQDAFQATFLVLVRKARGLWVRDSIGPWLHQVAFRAASRARSDAARRRRIERRAAESSGVDRPGVGEELGRILHEEVERLPERYRAPVVLCDLQGQSCEQAARHLGCPVGTVKSRLSRGRRRLRDRLSRRGLAPDAGWRTLVPPVSTALADATTVAAVRSVAARAIAPGSVAALAQGVLRSMSVIRCWKVASALFVLVATASGVALLAQDRPPDVAPRPAGAQRGDVPSLVVEPGKLRVSVLERGVVEATRVATLFSQVEGQSTIIRLLPEMTMVKKGQLVCELDSSPLRDQLNNQVIAVAGAEDAYRNAQRAREVAEIAVKEYAEGSYKDERDALNTEIGAAESGINQSAARLERTRRARKRLGELTAPGGPATPSDVVAEITLDDKIEDGERDLARLKATLELARGRMATLEKYTRDRTTRQLSMEVDRKRRDELYRASAWELEKTRVAKVERQIESCKIFAPADGELVYANEPGRVGRIQIEEGATVRERQLIARVLDLDGPMRVVVKVHEPRVNRVKPGLQVGIKVEPAPPGKTMAGTVEAVAPMADPLNPFGSKAEKVYTTRVGIKDASPWLRPGMTAEVEILIVELDHVLAVPVASVVSREGRDRVAVKRPEGGIDWREVSLGETNDNAVEVKQGLRAGEAVVLNPVAAMTEAEMRQFFGSPTGPARPAPAPR